jgi:hypothetical protein
MKDINLDQAEQLLNKHLHDDLRREWTLDYLQRLHEEHPNLEAFIVGCIEGWDSDFKGLIPQDIFLKPRLPMCTACLSCAAL